MPGAPPAPSSSQGARPPESHGRRAGVTVPLSSLRGERSWGIGEIGDLPAFGAWAARAGLRLVQLLPLAESAGADASPYLALSAFGIDPIYVSIAAIPDLPDGAAEAALARDLDRLERARRGAAVDHGAVRELKGRALRAAFARFDRVELAADTPRAAALRGFVDLHRAWLPDYALFRAIKDARAGVAWDQWPEGLRDRDPAALAEAERALADEVLFQEYAQWIAHAQWASARSELRALGVELMGDLPFMVSRDSADVWANRDQFHTGRSVGVPPMHADEEGQDWGFPAYHWDRMRADGFAWLRRRARYAGSLYDRFRIDHLVGFYRTYTRPAGARAGGKLPEGVFDPPDEDAQLAHGEAVLGAMIEAAAGSGARIIAEDLGMVPPWIRASLTRLGVPGYKVLRWEKDGATFRDPADYPALSVACFGTHDTDPVAAWWESLDDPERAALRALPELAGREADLGPAFTPEVHRALLDVIHGAGSELTLLLIQDVLGERTRINMPGTLLPENWTYRLPGTPAELDRDPAARAAAERVRESARATGRG